MAPVSMLGLASVLDRTIFTDHGPIVKRPLALLSGTDLKVLSQDTIEIPSASLTSADLGRVVEISGSSGARNDGSFRIAEVLNSIQARLENVNFDISDVALTTGSVVALANALRIAYNRHLSSINTVNSLDPIECHFLDDTTNVVTAPPSYDLTGAIAILNDVRTQYEAHRTNGGGAYHSASDVENVIYYPAATGLASAVWLANELFDKYKRHRLERVIHKAPDPNNYVNADRVVVSKNVYPGLLTGPFTWILYDPQTGMVADSPSDVDVRVNGIDADVEAVFGLLGAVVLVAKPTPTDTVLIDYDYVENPPSRFLRSNSFEYVLNQDGNWGICGLPPHRYRARSHIIDPGSTPDLASGFQPLRTQWKYKALERAYTAAQNDANLLLLNSPITKVTYDVLHELVEEYTIKYDPTVLPQNATDPWTLNGDGQFDLSTSGNELTIEDSSSSPGIGSNPPFFTHGMDVSTASNVSAAFRAFVETYLADGVFTGVAFGLSDGERVIVAGFILTEAIGLSSVMARANDLKAAFNAHVIESGVHTPNDEADVIEIVDATTLDLALILLNEIKSKYSAHAVKGDPLGVTKDVHALPDTTNLVTAADATDLVSAIALANDLADTYNAHRVETGVHWTDDVLNPVDRVRQIGILKNTGAPEFQDNWEGYATDWSILKTYRLYMASNGDASLYVSGSVDPVLEVEAALLPPLSSLGAKFDPLQQVFFGSISREAESVSKWALIRVNVSPVNANLIGDNKSVDYDATYVPEAASPPWISVGQGGAERIVPSDVLMLDSTCSLPTEDLDLIGMSSGTYRGFLRFEPILSSFTTCVVDFSALVNFHTFGVDNRASGVYMDDGTFAVHFAFLYFSPVSATVTGTAAVFSIAAGDKMSIHIDGGQVQTITFPTSTTLIADVISAINSSVGFTFASNDGGFVKLTSSTIGASSQIEIVSGSAVPKLGFGIGKWFGSDSSPEDRFAWYGNSLPDLEDPAWVSSGGQESLMMERILRIEDTDDADFLAYTMSNPTSTDTVLLPSGDWRVGFRLTVRSYGAGDALSGMYFAGALVNIDEGSFGKNLDAHLSVDSSDNGFIHLTSYNATTTFMDSVAQYPCAWNDGAWHSFEIIANKVADIIFVVWDGTILTPVGPAPTYTGLNGGSGSSKSLSFGSGSYPVGGYDLRTAESVVDWEAVWAFRDTKLNDASAGLNRYVGLHKGGDPSLMASWYLHQVDWSRQHDYRIVRNPLTSVSLFVDGSKVPAISENYDTLTFPASYSSFLRPVTNARSVIAFGAFNPQEISRVRWDYVRYSMGKLTITDRIVPSHQVSNQGNVIASAEHLRTPEVHEHYGFTTYSGGTPVDEFMANEDVDAFTILGERIPPIPMTQDLESRGGLVKDVTSTSGIDPLLFVNQRGFLGDFVDDTFNVVSQSAVTGVSTTETEIVTLANDLKAKYDAHLTEAGVHVANDFINGTVAPVATDLASAITLLNDIKVKYDSHLILATAHSPIDTYHAVTVVDATDVSSAADLANDIRTQYAAHIADGRFHAVDDVTNVVTASAAADRTSAALLADNLRAVSTSHSQNSGGAYHLMTDPSVPGMREIPGLVTGKITTGTFDRVSDCNLRVQVGDDVQFYDGPNAVFGFRTVTAIVSPTSFDIAPALSFLDTTGSHIMRVVGSLPQFETRALIDLANQLRDRFNLHLTKSGIHETDDILNTVTSPVAWNVDSAVTLLNEIRTDYGVHISGLLIHPLADSVNVLTASAVTDPLAYSILLANDLKTKFNLHVEEVRSHVNLDPDNAIASDDATDLSSLITLVNELKENFNDHRTAEDRELSGMHVADDTVNVVVLTDATDLTSAVDLVNQIRTMYEAHRTQEGVHGSSVFIRLDPPPRVLYNSMKFWATEDDGVTNLVAPFSDDETMYLSGAVKNTDEKSFSYLGKDLPERTIILSEGADPTLILAGDTLDIEVDGAIPVTVTFEATDVTTALVAARINGTTGLPATLASDSAGELQLTSPTTGTGSWVVVSGGTARQKLGLLVPQQAPWFIVSDDPTAVSVAHMGTFLRYGTTGTGAITAYRSELGIGMFPSTNFELTITMRVNSVWSGLSNYDSGIYAGISGKNGDDGYTAALGFDRIKGTYYVKIQDLNSGETVYRVPFDWNDGSFHTYRLLHDARDGVLRVEVVS